MMLLLGLVLNSGLNCCAQTNPIVVTNLLPQASPSSVSVRGPYLYVGGGGLGLTILDVSAPGNPVDTGYVDPLGASTAFVIAGADLYRLGGNGYAGAVSILDLTNPSNPSPVANIDGTFLQIKVSGSRLYLNGFADSETGLFVYDVSNPTMPAKLAVLASFTPSSQVLGEPVGSFAYPLAWLAYSTNADPRSAIAVPNTTAVSGNYLYALGPTSLVVWDISIPTQNVAVTSIPYSLFGSGIAVARGFAYAVGGGGLNIYSLGTAVSPPLSLATSPQGLLCSWPTPAPAFVMQQNPDLDPTHWTTLTNASVVVGRENQLTLPKPETTMFYRLVSQ